MGDIVILTNKDQLSLTKKLQEMYAFYRHGEFCDMVLIAGIDGQRYPCHRLMLASCSQYFKTMFRSPMRESQQSEIVLHEVNGAQLKPLLDFCYKDRMDVYEYDNHTKTSVKKLLCTASLLQLDAALETCADYLQMHLKPTNCLGIYALAEQHSLSELQRKAEEFTNRNFVYVCQQEEFLQLPYEQLALLLTSDKLNVSMEETIFCNTMRWVQNDPHCRLQYIPELMKLVRLPLLSPQFLRNEVQGICTAHDSTSLFSKVLSWQSAPESPTELSEQQTQPRWGSKKAELLMVYPKDKEIIIEIYNPVTNVWSPCGRVDKRYNLAAVVLNESLIFACSPLNSTIETVISFDLRRKTRRILCPMQTSRSYFGMAVLDDVIYVVGGKYYESLNSVERYHAATNTWHFVASMTSRRSKFGIAVMDGLLYAVGGCDGTSFLNSIESYNPERNEWTQRANMSQPRHNPAIAVSNGYLFVIGGETCQGFFHNTVERYNPSANHWTQLGKIENFTGIIKCAVVDERLLMCSCGVVQTYNLEDNRWCKWRSWSPKQSFEIISIPKMSNLKIEEVIN